MRSSFRMLGLSGNGPEEFPVWLSLQKVDCKINSRLLLRNDCIRFLQIPFNRAPLLCIQWTLPWLSSHALPALNILRPNGRGGASVF